MSKLVSLLLIFALVGCSGGGGGSTTAAPPTPPSSTNSNVTGQSSVFLGLLDFGQTTSKTLTITNTGTAQSKALGLGVSGSSAISININNCQSKKLNPNESCSISITYNVPANPGVATSYKKTITVADGTKSIQIPVYGYTANFNEVDYLIYQILNKQLKAADSFDLQGSWQTDDNVSHLSSNLTIVDALISGQSFYQGTLLNNDPLFTPNINFNTAPNANWKPLDHSLYYLLYKNANTSTYTDDTMVLFDPDAVGSDWNTSLTKWIFNEYDKPKFISASLLYKINENYKLIYNTNFPNYETIAAKYVDSRRIMSVNGSNQITGSTTDITAQLSYLINPNRMTTTLYVENPLKDILFYYEYLGSISDTTNINKIATFYSQHWEFNLDDLQNNTAVVNPVLNLKYNAFPFIYTSGGGYVMPGVDQTSLIDDKLWWIIDYANSGHFVNTLSCRDIAHSMLNLVSAYNLSSLDNTKKAKIALQIQDGFLELKNSLACFYDDSVKQYLSQDNGNGSFNQNNGLPLIARINHKLPDSIVSVDEKIASFNQLMAETAVGGSLDLDDSSANPLYLSETLKFLSEVKP